MKLSTILTNLTIWGERKPGNSTPAPQLPVGAGGVTYPRPKDSNAAAGVRDRATGKGLEGADIQTDRLSTHYSKIAE